MKGRIVYRGDCARNENGVAAVYEELGANPTSVQGLNACLAYSLRLFAGARMHGGGRRESLRPGLSQK